MLHHRILGEGDEPWFFLHGFLGSGRNLATVARRFLAARPDARVILVDLPGHGASSGELGASDDLFDAAYTVHRLCTHLGATQPHFVGHSMGGRIALAYSQAHPVNQLVMLDIAPGPIRAPTRLDPVMHALLDLPETPESRDHIRERLLEKGVSASLSDWLLMNLSSGPAPQWRIDRNALAEFQKRTRPQDLWSLAENIAPRLHTLASKTAGFVLDEDLQRLQNAGARTHQMEGVGHFLHAEKPDDVATWCANA